MSLSLDAINLVAHFRRTRAERHKRKLERIIKDVLGREPTNDSFDDDVKEVFQGLMGWHKKIEEERKKLYDSSSLEVEVIFRRAYAITGNPASYNITKVKKAAKICGVELFI